MKTIKHIFWGLVAVVLPILGFTGCSEWLEPRAVPMEIHAPAATDPAAWNQYLEQLKTFKASHHLITYAHFRNGAEKPVNEGNYLRSLPDSLDIVSIADFDALTDHDRQDVAGLREKGTKVLMCVDFAGKSAELSTPAALSAYLDKVLAAGKGLPLDGYSFTGLALFGGSEAEIAARRQAASAIVAKLSSETGKLLVLEGDPAFVAKEDLAKLDYVVLDTEKAKDITTVSLKLSFVRETTGLASDKLLVAAYPDGELSDENQLKHNSLELISGRVLDFGPLAGIVVYDIGRDYFSPLMNYERTRRLIKLLNISI